MTKSFPLGTGAVRKSRIGNHFISIQVRHGLNWKLASSSAHVLWAMQKIQLILPQIIKFYWLLAPLSSFHRDELSNASDAVSCFYCTSMVGSLFKMKEAGRNSASPVFTEGWFLGIH